MPVTLVRLTERYTACRLPPDAAPPQWARGEFVSITRTPSELSVFAPTACVPQGVRAESGWRLLAVKGPLAFEIVGLLAELSSQLAAANISIFAISTFDTDYIATRDDDFERALETLAAAGHTVDP